MDSVMLQYKSLLWLLFIDSTFQRPPYNLSVMILSSDFPLFTTTIAFKWSSLETSWIKQNKMKDNDLESKIFCKVSLDTESAHDYQE